MTGCLLSTGILEELHITTCHKVREATIVEVTNLINDDVTDVFTKPLSLEQYFPLMLRFWIFLAKRGFSSKPGGKNRNITDMEIFCDHASLSLTGHSKDLRGVSGKLEYTIGACQWWPKGHILMCGKMVG